MTRSSGHCETMLDGCRYTGDVVISRLTGAPDADPADAARVYLACVPCHARVSQPGRVAVFELGYRLDAATDPGAVPFFWRQSRWALLAPSGRLQPLSPTAAHRAS